MVCSQVEFSGYFFAVLIFKFFLFASISGIFAVGIFG